MRASSLVLALLLVLVAAPARAEKKAILLESYSDTRPMGMARNVTQITKAFGPARVLSGDELRKKLEESFSRPVTRASADEIQALIKRASDGSAAYTSSSFTVAISELTQAADGLANQSAVLALDPKLREVRRDALLTLAKALVKTNNTTAAQAALREVIRSFPEIQAFSEVQYHPRLVAIGNQVLKEKVEQAGSLAVETRPSRRRFFLNEQPAGSTPKTSTGLLPGTYRIYIPSADPRRGSLRLVEVKPRQTTTVAIDSEVDDQLEAESYIGLRFATRAEKDRFEIPLACAVARAVGAEEVILLTQQRSPSSETELLGAVYNAENGHREWGVILPLAPTPDDQALARFALSLRTRREVEGVKVAPEPPPPPKTEEPQPPAASASTTTTATPAITLQPATQPFDPNRRYTLTWIGVTVGIGIPMLAVGTGLWFYYGCNTDAETNMPGVGVAGSGRCFGASVGRELPLMMVTIGSSLALTGVAIAIWDAIDKAIDRRRRSKKVSPGIAPATNGMNATLKVNF